MKVNISSHDKKALRYQATASAEEVDRALEAAYAELSSSLGVVSASFDPKAIEAKAAELVGIKDAYPLIEPKVLARLVPLAIDAREHRPAFTPTAQTLAPITAGAPCTFAFTLTPKPRHTLSSRDAINVSIQKAVVTEEDIDAEILFIANEYVSRMQDTPRQNEGTTVEIDDAWVKNNAPWFKDYEGMRRIVRKNLEEFHEGNLENRKRQAVAIELAKRLEGPIENGSYAELKENLRLGLQAQLKQAGTDYASFVEEQGGEDAVSMMLLLQAREILTQGYALDALFAQEKLTLTQADIDRACLAMNSNQKPEETLAQARAMGRMHTLMETAERFKANDWLVEHATITIIDGGEGDGPGD